MITVDWVYAHSFSGWAGLFGKMPNLKIVCGSCGQVSKTRAQVSAERWVFVWCLHCGKANVARNLVAN